MFKLKRYFTYVQEQYPTVFFISYIFWAKVTLKAYFNQKHDSFW